MSRPFIILALPRCGTRMLSRSLSEHPECPSIQHNFTGSEVAFWRHPHALSHVLRDWMLDERIVRLHATRDYIAGARSILMMGYPFIDGGTTLPADEIVATARERQAQDSVMREVADYSVSYDALTRGRELTRLPSWFVRDFCRLVGINFEPVTVAERKDRRVRLRNEGQVQCLRV